MTVPEQSNMNPPVGRSLSRTVGYVTAGSYPFFLPYRLDGDMKGSHPSGRTPRLLAVFFSTLICGNDSSYDADKRVLRFHRGFRMLSKVFGTFNSQKSRKILADNLRLMADGRMVFPAKPDMRLIEDWHDDEFLSEMWVRFTPEYVSALTANPREIPLSPCVHTVGRPFELDMLVLAALYCPEDRQLLLSLDTLKAITPVTISSRRVLESSFNKLNALQDYWNYRLLKDRVSIRPNILNLTVGNALVLDTVRLGV